MQFPPLQSLTRTYCTHRERARTHRERARSCRRGGSGCSGSCWKPEWDNHACLAPGVDAAAVAGSGQDSERWVGLVPIWSYLDQMSRFSSIPGETRAMVARGVNAVLWEKSCVFANGGENSFRSDAQPRFGITWRRGERYPWEDIQETLFLFFF